MKHLRKVAALLLALAMILSLSITGFAAVNNSITINNAKPGETYDLYKLFDLIVDNAETPAKYSYTVNPAWAAFFAEGGAGRAYVKFDTETNTYITGITDAAALAKAAENWAGKPTAPLKSLTCAKGETSVVFEGLGNGYYLITSSLGTNAMTDTTPANQAVVIEEKNPVDQIKKKVKEDSTGSYGDKNDAQIGDVVEFKSTATLQPATTNVKIHDTMTLGLTYNGNAKIYTDEDCTKALDTDYYTVQGTPDEGDTFTIVFTEDYLATLKETTHLYVEYSATLNKNAIVFDTDANLAIAVQTNKTTISYGNSQSVSAKTTTTTHKVTVNKYAEGVENLAGAYFALKKGGEIVPLVKLDAQNYRVATAADIATEGATTEFFVTVADGDIKLWGLDTDTDYTLEELKAPDGYNMLGSEVPVNVEENITNGNAIDILNLSGTELPATGGMGTTLFYVVGGLMAAAAAILLITKKRMGSV